MNYQDVWLNGKLRSKGYRECESRYKVIRDFCEQTFQREPFTVCDIGAASCYFGLRLREDFPSCIVAAFEPREYAINRARLKRAKAGGIVLFGRKLTIEELPHLAALTSFDLVLALSVLHHIQKDQFTAWMDGLANLGHYLIAELAVSDSRSRGSVCSIPEDAVTLGYGSSHIRNNVNRPIILVNRTRA